MILKILHFFQNKFLFLVRPSHWPYNIFLFSFVQHRCIALNKDISRNHHLSLMNIYHILRGKFIWGYAILFNFKWNLKCGPRALYIRACAMIDRMTFFNGCFFCFDRFCILWFNDLIRKVIGPEVPARQLADLFF